MKGLFPDLPPALDRYCILFQAPAVVSEKVYIPPAFVALFHNTNDLVKELIQLFTQIFTVLWTAESAVWLTIVGGNSSVVLQFPSRIPYFSGLPGCL